MTATSRPGIARAELHRWSREPAVLITAAVLVVLSGLLTYLVVNAAVGGAPSGNGGVQLEVGTELDADATNDQLASIPRSSLVLLAPIAAVVLGVHAAGSEMASGALLLLAASARRLRFVFAVRAVIMLVITAIAGAAAGAAALGAAGAGVALNAEIAHLSAWHSAGPTIVGAAAQTVLIGLLAFGLAALTRRWVPVTIGMLVYLVALEPVLTGLLGEASVWLPGAATAQLLVPEPDLAHVVPTAAGALVFTVVAVLSLCRERAAR